MSFVNARVVIIPLSALGDLTIYIHLAWRFHCAGANVDLYSDPLYSAKEHFPWLSVKAKRRKELEKLAVEADLVIACFEECYAEVKKTQTSYLPGNIAFVSAKKIPPSSGIVGREVVVRGKRYQGATRAFCLDTRAGRSMAEWVDQYVNLVYMIDVNCALKPFMRSEASRASSLVLIFPTTPVLTKNYWLLGFRALAAALERRGWKVQFVCMPQETVKLTTALPRSSVVSCADLGKLIELVARAGTVVSNDSGGGHLASLLGLPTFTITRRRKKFVWRPGFNDSNVVLQPFFRFKLFGNYVWRPFIPLWRILFLLGTCRSDGGVSGSPSIEESRGLS
ncbi:glycosyltransferase family 9 protein [Pseudomonas sp. OIL-1]|uniref:glycosyltransferase family 9 protein n=1 Tax=Pseudomonas sp. OIL-1 TaxID=2706126 RepID=UPI0013A71110|nr:glycosyltransferase family 9 protein [Pseudomonas sp. OIL-1]QIB52988.1 ADP-heptose--LPS heptosyltransferase [Pseudomonas sp. OIL-1]